MCIKSNVDSFCQKSWRAHLSQYLTPLLTKKKLLKQFSYKVLSWSKEVNSEAHKYFKSKTFKKIQQFSKWNVDFKKISSFFYHQHVDNIMSFWYSQEGYYSTT